MSTEINHALMQAINAVSSSHESVYGKAQGYSLDTWIEDQKFLAGGAGATAAIVPGTHLAGMAADLAFLLNRMHTCSFGVGTILGNEYFDGSILEEEDFYNVLALWSGDDDARRLIEQKTSYVVLSQLGVKGGTRLIGKAVAKHLGLFAAHTVSHKLVSKLGAKFGSKLLAKGAAGFVPVLGAAASGGINVWFINGIADAAKSYDDWKRTVTLDAIK